jgi:RNA polymerase sigma-70 factor (ECF subfamily)
LADEHANPSTRWWDRHSGLPTDPAARFRELAWPHLATVLRVAQILTGNAADAEDLAQETMLKAFKAIHTLRDGAGAEASVKAWLLAILRNTRIDRLRSAGQKSAPLSLDALDLEPVQPGNTDPAGLAGAGEPWEKPQEVLAAFSDQQVIEALQRLPEEIRLTLLLVDVEQLDHHEAADVLRVPVGTIKSRTHRGRAMLRVALAPVARDLGLLPR